METKNNNILKEVKCCLKKYKLKYYCYIVEEGVFNSAVYIFKDKQAKDKINTNKAIALVMFERPHFTVSVKGKARGFVEETKTIQEALDLLIIGLKKKG